MEAGGIHLNDIYVASNKTPFESFKEFIRGLEIWGSYQPLRHIYSSDVDDIKFHHTTALNKIKEFVRKLDQFLSHNRPRASTKLETSILEDLEVISSIFPMMYQKLYIMHNNSPKNQAGKSTLGHSATLEEAHFLTLRKEDDVVNKKPTIIEINPKVEMDNESIKSLSTSSSLGHLIPLSCGHNGCLNNTERALFDYHLKKSGFA